MKSIFFAISLFFILSFFNDVIYMHQPFNDNYYMLIFSAVSAIALFITIIIERKKQGRKA